MNTDDAIIIALLVAILIVVLYYNGMPGYRSRFTGGGPVINHSEDSNPYPALHRQLEASRGRRHDGYNQTPTWQKQHHSSPTHEQISEAERGQWLAATEENSTGAFNTELAQDAQTDTMQYHTAQPSMDYGGYITDLIADPRTRENHARFAADMKPFSGGALKVDDLDEALEAGTHFHGLRRPQATVQKKTAHQLTEVDASILASNPKFNFKG
jgi:hypothetical protein